MTQHVLNTCHENWYIYTRMWPAQRTGESGMAKANSKFWSGRIMQIHYWY